MKRYFESIMHTINEAINDLDQKKFLELIEDTKKTLMRGNKVVTTGLGKNVPICEKFVGTMLSFGLDATFMHTNTAIHGDLGAIHNGDLVIILSKSGETAESIYLLNELKKRDIIIWAMTFNGSSTLARNSDKCLTINMENEGDKWNIVPNNSTTLYLIILQALAIQLSDEMNITLEDFHNNHPGGHIGVQLDARK